MKKLRSITAFMAAALLAMSVLSGCSSSNSQPSPTEKPEQTQKEEPQDDSQNQQAEKTTIRVAMLKGPTGIGAVKLMEDAKQETTANDYQFQILSAPDDVVAKVVSKEVDVAAVPTNLAAVLYNKTDGGIQMAAVNTLGVLYLLENGDTIHSLKDLEGKTILASGQGATPEYVLNYLLDAAEVENVTVEYKAEHAELAALLASGQASIGLLPEPNVTAVLMKNENTRIALDFSQQWEDAKENNGALVMGGLIVRKEFLEENKEAFDKFLEEYQQSIEYVNTNIESAASLVEEYEIMANAKAAEKAIPNCNIVYLDGQQMKEDSQTFFDVLFEANPKSVGGKLPDDEFYYQK